MCAGYDNGDIKLFDLRNMAVRWETNIRNGVRGGGSVVTVCYRMQLSGYSMLL